MTFNELKYHLPTFLLFFGLASFYWRKMRIKNALLRLEGNTEFLKSISKVNKWFNGLFVLVCAIVVFYSFFNGAYNFLMLPIEALDKAPVNNFGVTILNVSLIWVIVTQMNLDLMLFRITSGKIDRETLRKIIVYSEKSILLGFLIMLIGIFVTISSVISLVATVAGIAVYYFIFIRKVNDNTPHTLMF